MSTHRTKELRIVGFDLGHADTALAVVPDVREDEVIKQELPSAAGRTYVSVTAVAEHPQKGVILGVFAINQEDAKLHVAFKDPSFDEDKVARPTRLFVEGVRADLKRVGRLPDDRPTRWVFGTPSGWPPEVREAYLKVLREAGLTDVEVVAESRAALLFARDSGEVRDRPARSRGRLQLSTSDTVLVADLGSSTLDITIVTGRRANPVKDAGSALGASLIDIAIMNWFLRESPYRADVERCIEWNDFERKRLQFACRMAKEDFFTKDHPSAQQVVGTYTYEPLGGDENAFYPIRIGRKAMEQILDTPQPALGGRGWREAFRDDLRLAAAAVRGKPSHVVLTGGASRMTFVLAYAREIFGDRVVMGSEPELAIARGLALAGRISERAKGFRADIAAFLSGGMVETVVRNHLGDLATKLGDAVASGAFEAHAIPAFRRWKRGEFRTLAEMERRIAEAVSASLTAPDNTKVQAAIAEWQNGLHPDLKDLTAPICRRWHIQDEAMELAPVSVRDQTWSPTVGLAVVFADQAAAIAGVVASVVVGIIAAAIFSAMALGGPATWFLGITAVVWAGGGAAGKADELVRTANIPLAGREMFREASLVKKAPQKEQELAANLSQKIRTDGADTIVAQVALQLALELEEQAKEAELLIS